MYYKFTPVPDPNDTKRIIEFKPQQVVQEESGIDVLAGKTKEVSVLSDQEAFTFLGYIVNDSGATGYYHVVDGVTPVEQPAEINATQLDVLPTEVSNELAINGDYAKHQRFLGGISTMPIHTNYNDEHNYAELQAQLTDVLTVLGVLLEAQPSTLGIDDNTLLRVRNTIKRNSSINSNIQNALSKVGL